MRDFLIVIFALGAVLALFHLRVKQAGGWLILGKKKIQKLFPTKTRINSAMPHCAMEF